MSLEQDIVTLLAPLPPKISTLARQVIGVAGAHPGLSGSVRFGWRSVNFRHELAGHVCAVFPYPDRVALYFEHGRRLQAACPQLEGDLKRGAFLRFLPGAMTDKTLVELLLAEAIAFKC